MNKSNSSKRYRVEKRKDGPHIFRWVLLAAVLIFITACVIGGVYAINLVKDMASEVTGFDPSALLPSEKTYVYTSDGEVIGELYGDQNREYVTIDEVPETLKNAFIAIEDQRFEEHFGVDVKGLIRALVTNTIKSGNPFDGQGASTITQQLARNAFLNQETSLERKIKEAWLAIQLERTYTKDQILEYYLNTIYFGNTAYGVKTAALTYFNKDLDELTLAECATIAGAAKGPSYSPLNNYDDAMYRKDLVLDKMSELLYIDYDEMIAAKEDVIVLETAVKVYDYPYFVDFVQSEAYDVLADLGYTSDEVESLIFGGGLRIYTTINVPAQLEAEKVMADPDNYPDSEEDDKGIMQPQSSLVVLDQYTGAIQAIVGGREHYQKMGLNRAADSKRQPGSTIKPITVYSTALSKGYPASYIIDDSPMSPAETGSKSWLPTNHTGKFEGLMTMRRAVQTSCNVAAVRMGMQIGIEPMFEMGRNMGLKSLIGEGSSTDKGYAPLCLGGLTYGVTNVELASAYGTIANGGTYIEPYAIEKITDKEGKVIYEADPEIVEGVLTEEVSWLLTDVLKSVVSSGTGSKAKFGGWDVAGKTGTTNARKDVWFAGFTNRYVCTVWIGCDQPTPMTGASVWGSTYCAPMWKSVMIAAHEGLEAEKFADKPEGIIGPIAVDGVSGKLPTQYSALDPRGSKVYSEYYLKGTQPVLADDVHVAYDICTECGLLANEFCPDELVESKVFINRPDYYLGELNADGTYKSKGEPEDAQYKAPTEICTVHTFLDNDSIIIPIEPTVPENPDDPGWTEVPSEGETTPEEVTTPAVTEPEVVTPAA